MAGAALFALSALGVGANRVAASSGAITITGSMEGNLPVNPNDLLRAGYDFTMPGSHPGATVTVSNGTVSLTVNCPNGTSEPLTIVLPTQTYTDPAGSSNWFPSGDQSSSLVYQGSLTVPSTSCGGQQGHAPAGATFTATFSSTDTTDPVHIRFHYADNTAGSWSGTASIVPGSPSPTKATVWLQTLDSCRKAIGGATFQVLDSGGAVVATASAPGEPSTPGGGPTTVASGGSCPLQGGNCVSVPVGCVNFALDIPASGTATYTVQETVVPTDPDNDNDGYVPCNGGSACQSETMTITIDSGGNVRATSTGVNPDGTASPTLPASDPNTGFAFWTGTASDPALFYDYQLGTISCDGDNDLDDHNSGTVAPKHCDNDKD